MFSYLVTKLGMFSDGPCSAILAVWSADRMEPAKNSFKNYKFPSILKGVPIIKG